VQKALSSGASGIEFLQYLVRAANGALGRSANDLRQDPRHAARRAERGQRASIGHTPAAVSMRAECRVPASSAQPGSDTLTDAKSGRATASRLAHSAMAWYRAPESPPVIHSPVDTVQAHLHPLNAAGHAAILAPDGPS
jgi:hypothetical protein